MSKAVKKVITAVQKAAPSKKEMAKIAEAAVIAAGKYRAGGLPPASETAEQDAKSEDINPEVPSTSAQKTSAAATFENILQRSGHGGL
jgi:hypothetical protein